MSAILYYLITACYIVVIVFDFDKAGICLNAVYIIICFAVLVNKAVLDLRLYKDHLAVSIKVIVALIHKTIC